MCVICRAKLKAMHLTDDEFINPYNAANLQFWMKVEHLARYLYAAWVFERQGVNGTHVDMGCGDGYGIAALAKRQPGRNYIGIDYDAELLAKAPTTLADWRQLDMDKQPLGLTGIASVTAFEVLEHVENPSYILQQLHQAMLPNAWLLVSLPNPRFEKLNENGKPISQHHHHAFSREQAEAMLQQAGFAVQEVLGQSLTNRLFSRERNLVSGGVLEKAPFTDAALQTPQMIEAMANLMAWPFDEQLDSTYSYLYICRRAATGGEA